MKILVPIVLLSLLTFASCKKTTEPIIIDPYHDAYIETSKVLDVPEIAVDYAPEFPSYLTRNGFIIPKVDNEKATLGRVLFYDKNLSKTNEVSCASCHIQEKAFADGKKVSDGINNRQTTRNSIGLTSAISIGSSYGSGSTPGSFGGGAINFFWDDRAESVAEQATQSLASDREMGMSMHEVVSRVKENQKYYKWLFMEAYPDGISEDNILDAIQQFVNTMGSFHSRFDEGMEANNGNAEDDFANFTVSENKGKQIFMEKCASCHSQFAARSLVPVANNGLYLHYQDKGRGALPNHTSAENGVFKVPSLRNVALTAPYMHNGSFATLDDVVEHYISGIKNHVNLHPNLTTYGQPGLGLTHADKAPLVAFLKTLTDESVRTDKRFSDPFK